MKSLIIGKLIQYGTDVETYSFTAKELQFFFFVKIIRTSGYSIFVLALCIAWQQKFEYSTPEKPAILSCVSG